jgi:hypothetical protein
MISTISRRRCTSILIGKRSCGSWAATNWHGNAIGLLERSVACSPGRERSRSCEVENGSRRESGIGCAMQENGPRNHRAWPKRVKVTQGFNAVVHKLCTPHITRQKLLSLFDNRASFASIRAWRYGWRAPPRWAADMLKTKIRAHAQETLQYESTIVARKGSHGWRGPENLAVWRERKARERDERSKKES